MLYLALLLIVVVLILVLEASDSENTILKTEIEELRVMLARGGTR